MPVKAGILDSARANENKFETRCSLVDHKMPRDIVCGLTGILLARYSPGT